jgi:hypothetical protein
MGRILRRRLVCPGLTSGSPVGQRREGFFVGKNGNNRGTRLWKMLFTDLLTVDAATFKLILLVNHPIELVE